MVQYYRDLWEKRRSHLIAPLTDLIGECGETKTTKKKKTKKKPFYWSEVHNQAFEAIKKVIAREVMLAYPDYSEPLRPENIKSLRKFLGMVQYYCDLWENRSPLIAPLTDLIGECGETKMTKKKKKGANFNWGNAKNVVLCQRSSDP